jgi:CHU_C Type IX secretion signal domain
MHATLQYRHRKHIGEPTLFCFCVFLGLSVNGVQAQAGMPVDTAVFTRTFCENQLVIINSNVYSATNPTGVEVIPGGSSNGTDSIFKVNLIYLDPVERDVVYTICDGDTIVVNGTAYHAANYEGTEVYPGAAANGCDSIEHIQVFLEVAPFYYLVDTLCEGTFITINNQRYDEERPFGLEILEGASAEGCDSLVYINLAFRTTWVSLGGDRTFIAGDRVCISALSSDLSGSFDWTPVPLCGGCSVICTDTLRNTLTYSIAMTDRWGCVATDQITITVTDEHQIFAPTVFSPSASPPNHRFMLYADPGVIRINRLVIYNRWGEPVYEQQRIPMDNAASQLGWDGTWKGRLLNPDVYGWVAELQTFDGRIIQRSGDTTLLR